MFRCDITAQLAHQKFGSFGRAFLEQPWRERLTQLDQLPDAAELPTTSDVEQMLVPSADVTLEQLRGSIAGWSNMGLCSMAGYARMRPCPNF